MDSSSSSALTEKKPKLSVRKQTCFKKPRPSSSSVINIPAAKTKTTNLSMREQTLLTKAYELSTLCGNEVCVIHYGPDGELKTYPKDQSKVRDMAERFTRLSDVERRKKSSNLSQFLNKKMNKEKQTSLDQNDNKFQNKVLEMEYSLETRLQVLQDKLRFLSNHDQTVASMITEQNNNFTSYPLMTTIPTSLIEEQSCDVYNAGGFAIDSSNLNQNQNKFSLFLYNRENNTVTQLPADSGSSFDLGFTPSPSSLSTGLLGGQGFFGEDGIGLMGSCSNDNNIPTQNSFVQSWNQTPFYGGGDPMMFSSYN